MAGMMAGMVITLVMVIVPGGSAGPISGLSGTLLGICKLEAESSRITGSHPFPIPLRKLVTENEDTELRDRERCGFI